jgi:hypothetical protein
MATTRVFFLGIICIPWAPNKTNFGPSTQRVCKLQAFSVTTPCSWLLQVLAAIHIEKK